MALVKKNMNLIIDLIKNNGVSFVKLFFKSTLSDEEISELDEGLIKENWVIDFSDGKQYLGSVKVTASTFEDASDKGVKPVRLDYSVQATGEITGLEKAFHLRLIFNGPTYRTGECYILMSE